VHTLSILVFVSFVVVTTVLACCRHTGGAKTLECWQCGRNIDDVAERYFCECGVVQPPVTKRSYFDVMGIKETFDVDLSELTEKYRSLQRILHPDKYSQKCDVCIFLLNFLYF